MKEKKVIYVRVKEDSSIESDEERNRERNVRYNSCS